MSNHQYMSTGDCVVNRLNELQNNLDGLDINERLEFALLALADMLDNLDTRIHNSNTALLTLADLLSRVSEALERANREALL